MTEPDLAKALNHAISDAVTDDSGQLIKRKKKKKKKKKKSGSKVKG